MRFLQSKYSRDFENTFEEVYLNYNEAVYANIFKFVKNKELAEDILQDVFTTLWEKRHTIDFENGVGGWLFVVSHNKSLSSLRKKVKEAKTLFEILKPNEVQEVLNFKEEDFQLKLDIVEEAIRKLSDAKRKVYVLSKFENLSNKEVAARLGISLHTVKDYIKESNKFIKKYILSQSPEFHTLVSFLLVYS